MERCSQMVFENGQDKEYENALELVKQSGVADGVTAAINLLTQAIGKYEALVGWKDSENRDQECQSQKEALIKSTYNHYMTTKAYMKAREVYESLEEYENSEELKKPHRNVRKRVYT